MEGLNVAMRVACNNGLYKGIKIERDGPLISHLFYVDDALFVGE